MTKFAASLVIALALTAALPAMGVTERLSSAKDLFYRQLDAPKLALNNGMQYWIELKRDGKISRVNSRFLFRTADEIRFHITPNTDGFAYIILRQGSSGNRSVLFPDPGHADDQVVTAAKEYAIPGDGFLEFDDAEGTEKLTILIARQRIMPERYLEDAFKDKVVVASRLDGSKDLVPGSFVVAYTGTAQPVDLPKPVELPKPAEPTKVTEPTEPTATAANPVAIDGAKPPAGKVNDDAVITIVQTQPSNVLAVDIILEHGGRERKP